jgi:hypothetical protein
MRRSGITSIAVAALIVVILAGVLLLAYIARAGGHDRALIQKVEEVGRASKAGVKVIAWRGLIGNSPNAWIIIHDLYGFGTTIDYILGADSKGNVAYQSSQLNIAVKGCRAVRASSIGLPATFTSLNNSYPRLIIHSTDGVVVEAEYRKPLPEEVYPCQVEPPQGAVYPVNIKVWLRGCDGKENACGQGLCDNAVEMKKTCAKPLCNPGSPPGGGQGDQGVPVEPYSVLTLKAKPTITVQGRDYMFYGWLVELTPPKQGSELYRDNPLQLFVDDNMQVKAIYVEVNCGK